MAEIIFEMVDNRMSAGNSVDLANVDCWAKCDNLSVVTGDCLLVGKWAGASFSVRIKDFPRDLNPFWARIEFDIKAIMLL